MEEFKISEQVKTKIKNVLNKFTLSTNTNRIIVVEEFETREEVVAKKNWMGTWSSYKEFYCTKLKITSYNDLGDFIGVYDDSTAKDFINQLNFMQMRKNWIDLRRQLEKYGYIITEKPKTKDDKLESTVDLLYTFAIDFLKEPKTELTKGDLLAWVAKRSA